MALGLTVTTTAQQNLVVPLNASVVKIASLGSGVLATAVATGASANRTFSLQGAPSWISLADTSSGTTQSAEIRFANAPAQIDPYNIQVIVKDGTSTSIFPLSILVREPLSVREINGLTTASIKSYDASATPIKFLAIGANSQPATFVKFIAPTQLPQGVFFTTDDSDNAYLQFQAPSSSVPSGGLIYSGSAILPVTIKAYKANTLYDTPENAATLTFNLNVVSEQAGTPRAVLGGFYDTTIKAMRLEALAEFVGGKPVAGSYNWTATGATGRILGGGTSADKSMVWEPTASGDVTFTFELKNTQGQVLATSSYGPVYVSTKNPTAVSDNWTTTDGIPVAIFPAVFYTQEAGKKAYIRVSVPDLLSSETAELTVQVTPVGSAPAISDAPVDPIEILGSGASRSAIVQFTIPANAAYHDAWQVQVHASTGTGAGARNGVASVAVISTGAPAVYIQPASSDIVASTGLPITPVGLRAFTYDQAALPSDPTDEFFSLVPNQYNSTPRDLIGVSWRVVNGPEGIVPNSGNQIQGTIRTAGTYKFQIYAEKTGYGKAISSDISILTSELTTPITNISFASSNAKVIADSQFQLYWGYTGAAEFTIQKNNEPPVVVQGLSKGFQITSTSTFVLKGTNALGEYFAVPLLVQVDSVGSLSKLPPSPTLAIIDENNSLDLTWQPIQINGSYDAYASWKVFIQDGTSNPVEIIKSDGTAITGLELGQIDARRFKFNVSAGQHTLNMIAHAATTQVLDSDPWDTPKTFPVMGTVSFSKDTALKNEPVTITIGDGFVGDRWRLKYDDQTATDWLPLSLKSVAKAFGSGGTTQHVVIEVEEDYSTSLPPVKLRRSLTKDLYIVDQEYLPPEGADSTLGSVGFGSELGYEITDPNKQGLAPQPYMVAVKAIVKDEVTQELKLMIASSRTRDASSLLGTMAVDVFPIAGRPQLKSLVNPVLPFSSNDSATQVTPVYIVTDALPKVIVGKPMNEVKLQATGGLQPYSWSALNIPSGLRFTADGVLSGTVLQPGAFSIDFAVRDNTHPPFMNEKTIRLIAESDLAITTTSLPNPQVGVPYSVTLEATGGVKAYYWSIVSGDLPLGLSLDPNSGVLSGYPVTYTAPGTEYVIVAQVQDSLSSRVSKQYRITLLPHPFTVGDIDQTALFTGQQFVLRAPVFGGVGPYTITGTIAPNGFSIPATIDNGVLEISFDGTATPGTYSYSITVKDGEDTSIQKVFTIAVNTTLGGIGFAKPNVGLFFNSANDSATLDVVDLLSTEDIAGPASFTSQNGVVATLNSTKTAFTLKGPATSQVQSRSYAQVQVTRAGLPVGTIIRDYIFGTYTGQFTAAVPGVMSIALDPVSVGDEIQIDPQGSYMNCFRVVRNKTWTVVLPQGSQLPLGLSLDSSTGLIYGKVFNRQILATTLELRDNQDALVGTLNLTWNIVGSELSLAAPFTPLMTKEVSYSSYHTALGITPGSSAVQATVIAGRLPQGISLSINGAVVGLVGKPKEAGYFDVWIKLQDGVDPNKTGLVYQRFGVKFLDALNISTATLPTIAANTPYNTSLSAIGGTAPYTWELVSGTLPTGITLSTSGAISGTTAITSFSQDLTFKVTDSSAGTPNTAQKVFHVAVAVPDPLVITTPSLPDAHKGVVYVDAFNPGGYGLSVTGGVGPYSWAISAGSLPAGLQFNNQSGLIYGTPTTAGISTITFSVTDNEQPTQVTVSKQFTLTVSDQLAVNIITDSLPDGTTGIQYLGAASTTTQINPFTPGDTYIAYSVNEHTATTIPANGKILVVGGHNGSAIVNNVLLYDYANTLNHFSTLTFPTTIAGQAAAGLPNGDVLIAGGRNNSSVSQNKVYTYVAATNAFQTQNANLPVPVHSHAMVAMPSGKVVVFGGMNEITSNPDTTQILNNAPTSRAWVGTSTVSAAQYAAAPGPNYPKQIYNAAASTLLDGRVLVTGGTTTNLTTGTDVAVCNIYDPNTNLWTATANLPAAVSEHVQVTTPNGQVWVIGGDQPGGITGPSKACRVSIWTPSTGLWATGPQINGDPKLYHAASVLSDGRVIVTGGQSNLIDDGNGWTSAWTNRTIIYVPSTGGWIDGPAMPGGKGYHAQVTLADGRILVTGGQGDGHTPFATWILNPTTLVWSIAADIPLNITNNPTAILMADGKVLVMGGTSNLEPNGNTKFLIYNPITDTWSAGATFFDINTVKWGAAITQLLDHRIMMVGGQGGILGTGTTIWNSPTYISNLTKFYTAQATTGVLSFTWGDVEGLPKPLVYHSACVIKGGPYDGRVLVLGGLTGTEYSNTVDTNTVDYVYDPANDTLTVDGVDSTSVVYTDSQLTQQGYTYDATTGLWTNSRTIRTGSVVQGGISGQNTEGYIIDYATAITSLATTGIAPYTTIATPPLVGNKCLLEPLGNGKILLTGAQTQTSSNTDSYIYDSGSNTWAKAASTPAAIGYSAIAPLPGGTKHWIVSGLWNGTRSNNTLVYDASIDLTAQSSTTSWANSVPLAKMVLSTRMAIVGTGQYTKYLNVGYSGALDGHGLSYRGSTDTNWTLYDVPDWISTYGTAAGQQGLTGHSITTLADGRVAIVGGQFGASRAPGVAINNQVTYIISDVSSVHYSHSTNLNLNLQDVGLVSIGSVLYLIGGIQSGSKTSNILSYDTVGGGTPSIVGALPNSVDWAEACVLTSGTVFVVAGDGAANRVFIRAAAGTWQAAGWQTLSNPTAVFGQGCRVIALTNNKALLVGGTGVTGKSYAIFDGNTNTWSGVSNTPYNLSYFGLTRLINEQSDKFLLTAGANPTQTTASYTFDLSLALNPTLGTEVRLAATGGILPYTWSLAPGSSPLPTGLTLSPTLGSITGTPSVAFNGSINFAVTDNQNPKVTATKSLPLRIIAPTQLAITGPVGTTLPTIKTSLQPPPVTFAATGGAPAYNWTLTSITPSLNAPAMALDLTTGVLTFSVPGTTWSGTVRVTVTDTKNVSTYKDYTLSVVSSSTPIITTTSVPDGEVGQPYSVPLTENGGVGPFTWAVKTGSTLPAGLVINSSTGAITGTPTAGINSSFTITITDSQQLTTERTFPITVYPVTPLTITGPTTIADMKVGTVPPTYALTASGGKPPYTYGKIQFIPATNAPTITINANTGAFSFGTPTAAWSGTLTLWVNDNSTAAPVHVEKTYTFDVLPAVTPALTNASLPAASVCTSYAAQLLASGGTGTGYVFSIDPTSAVSSTQLASYGLTLSASGAISGTPNQAGTWAVKFKVVDSLGYTSSTTLNIVSACAINTSPALPVITANSGAGVNVDLSAFVTGEHGGVTFSGATGLPAGLTLSSAGMLTGTAPAYATTTNIAFNATITDSGCGVCHGTFDFQLTVTGASAMSITWPTPNLTINLVPGQLYTSQILTAAGGVPFTDAHSTIGTGTWTGLNQPHYHWAFSTVPPTGLSIQASAAGGFVITGTPTAGTYSNIIIKASDNSGLADATVSVNFVVASPHTYTTLIDQLTGASTDDLGIIYIGAGSDDGYVDHRGNAAQVVVTNIASTDTAAQWSSISFSVPWLSIAGPGVIYTATNGQRCVKWTVIKPAAATVTAAENVPVTVTFPDGATHPYNITIRNRRPVPVLALTAGSVTFDPGSSTPAP